MVSLVVFLNLFFVPAIALWGDYKSRDLPLKPSVKLLLEYAIYASLNVQLTKIGVVFFRLSAGFDITIDSGYYTILAILSSLFLGYLSNFARKALKQAKRRWEKNGKAFHFRREMRYGQKLLNALPAAFLIVITYIIRVPLEIYVKNAHEFLFSVWDFLPYTLAAGVAALLLLSALAALLPDAPFRFVSALFLWFGAASWVQDLFLNKKIAEINGAPLDWASLGSLPKYNALIWILLLAAALLAFVHCRRTWFSISRLAAGAMCVIQAVAIVSIFLSLPEKPPQERSLFVSGEKQMKLAYEDNLIVFLLDTVTSSAPERMLEVYPEAAGIMKDFTFYNNACCDYYYTFPSITHFLTGSELDVEATAEEWMRQAWTSERCAKFWDKIHERGYESRIYCGNSGVAYALGSLEMLTAAFDNIEEIESETHRLLLLQKILKLSIFRCLPYVWKQPFEVLTMDFNDIVTPVDVRFPAADNSAYYQRLKTENLEIDNQQAKLFSFQYLNGTHPPYRTDSQASPVEEATLEETTRGCFHILDEYFQQLKRLGIYDNATIIVLSDHGDQTIDGLAPIFYLKKPNETHDQTRINSAPVAHQDFQATILDLLGCNDGNFGTSIFEWKQGDERERTLYLRIYDDSEPPIPNSPWNRYHGYTYYTDEEELKRRVTEGNPDIIIPANRWSPQMELW